VENQFMTPEVTMETLTQRMHWQTFLNLVILLWHRRQPQKFMVRFSSGAADGLPINSILEQRRAGAGWGLNRAALSGFSFFSLLFVFSLQFGQWCSTVRYRQDGS